MRKTKAILTILFIVSFAFSNAQKYVKPYYTFDRISTENIKIEKGLSQNSVYTILQDSKGYMWFGTWDGLNKYDGYDFVVFRPSSFDSVSNLSDETIYCIYEDIDRNLWIGTEKGINKYSSKNQRFSKIYTKERKGFLRDTINSIIGDDEGNLWFATNKGLIKYYEDKGTLEIYIKKENENNSISNNHVLSLEIIQNKLWIGTEGGLDCMDLSTNQFKHYNRNTDLRLPSDTIYQTVADDEGSVWIATANGLAKMDIQNETVRIYKSSRNSFQSNDIRAVLYDSGKRLWIGTFGGGLSLYNEDDDRFYTYKYNTTDRKTLGSNYIYSLYEDDGGLIWIGTRKGVSKIGVNSYKFNHIYFHANSNNSLNSDIIWSFEEDVDGNLWVATDNGINVYNRKTNGYRYIKNQPNVDNSLICNDVRCIFFDDSGYLWIGTNCKGLDKYDLKNNKFIHHKKENSNISSNQIWDIKEDYRQNIWVATSDGLTMIDRENDTLIVFRHKESGLRRSLAHNTVYSILVDSTNLWLATLGGLSILDINTKQFRTIQASKIGNSLSTDKLFSVFKDSEGIYWIGTINGGLNRYDPKSDEFINYSTKDGLANNVIYNILEDNQGDLWMSTNYGISKFNKRNGVFVNFDVRDGLQSNEFNLGAVYESHTGELIFGGMNGFNSFYPNSLKRNDFMPKIIITSFEILNREIPLEYENGDSIILDYKNNFFSFQFAGLDFSKPEKIRYAYMLENFNKDWIYTDASKRFAEYTDVNPGNYVFRVKCTNSDGIMNDGIAIYIRIKPPWWRTYAFWVPFAFFVVFFFSNILYFRIRRIKQKNELQAKMLMIEKELFELEQKALRLQMNPHFIFNSLNSIQSFILDNNRDKAVRYLSKFAKLMRLILYNTKESFINFSDELKAINYYLELEKLRFESKFDYKISIDKQIDVDFIYVPPMLVQPYIENAILHGVINKTDKGVITIDFVQQQECIQCIVQDNGIGRIKAAELKSKSGLKHKSRSMDITRERLHIMGTQFKGKSSVEIIDLYSGDSPTGTKVIIDIPFKC